MRCLELPKRITILLNPKENRYELYNIFPTFAADPSCNSIYNKTLLFHYAHIGTAHCSVLTQSYVYTIILCLAKL